MLPSTEIVSASYYTRFFNFFFMYVWNYSFEDDFFKFLALEEVFHPRDLQKARPWG
jgi:hypothetical protein